MIDCGFETFADKYLELWELKIFVRSLFLVHIVGASLYDFSLCQAWTSAILHHNIKNWVIFCLKSQNSFEENPLSIYIRMILSKDTLYRVLLLLLFIIIIENFCSRTKYAFMLGGGGSKFATKCTWERNRTFSSN